MGTYNRLAPRLGCTDVEKKTEGIIIADWEYGDMISDMREFEKYHRQSFSSLAKDPESWLFMAKNLKNAADALRNSCWPKERCFRDLDAATSDFLTGPVYMLLAGLAVETLIKGIIVGSHRELVEEQKLSTELTHHNLPRLYKKAGLIENALQNNLLLRLQNYVENFGRYPVTKTKQEMEKMTQTQFCGDTDFISVDRLWDFLCKKIQNYIEDK